MDFQNGSVTVAGQVFESGEVCIFLLENVMQGKLESKEFFSTHKKAGGFVDLPEYKKNWLNG